MSHSRAGVGRAQAPGPPDGGASDSLAAGRASPLHHGPSLSLPAVRLHHASHHALCHALHAPFITPSATPLHHAPSTRPFGTLPHHAPSSRPPPRPSITPSPERGARCARRSRRPARRPRVDAEACGPSRSESVRVGPSRDGSPAPLQRVTQRAWPPRGPEAVCAFRGACRGGRSRLGLSLHLSCLSRSVSGRC